MSQWISALRQLTRRPSFTLAAIALLGLGIGINSILFSLVDTILLKSLPYPDADQLVSLNEQNGAKPEGLSPLAPARLDDWNRLNQTFAAITGYYGENLTDASGAEPERLVARRVMSRYFEVFASPPVVGRTFNADEYRFGGPSAAVISYAFWERRFNRDPQVTGKRLLVGGQSYPIIGVMPKEFSSAKLDAWVPAPMNPYIATARDARFMFCAGRMKRGVTLEQGLADLRRVQSQLAIQYPKSDAGWTAIGKPLKDSVTGTSRSWLLMLIGASGLLLCIACANVAGLLIGQLEQRRKEMAIRASLGAGRLSLLVLVLREVLLVSLAGAAAGAIISVWGLDLASKLNGVLPRTQELVWNWRSLAFPAASALATTLLVGLFPALRIRYSGLAAAMAAGSRSSTVRTGWFQQSLLLGQITLTVVLLSSAGLLLRSYWLITEARTGFSSDHVMTFHVGAEWSEDRPRIGKMQQAILTALEQNPQVESAGFANFIPAEGANLRYQYAIDGLDVGQFHTGGSRTVTAGYLRALQIPLVSGASCPDFQQDGPRPSRALLNRAFVNRYGQGQNLIGRTLRIDGIPGQIEIAGVIGDAREDSLRSDPVPYVYHCATPGGWPDPEYTIRYKGDSTSIAAVIRETVHKIAPGRAIFGLESLDDRLSATLDEPRLTARLLLGFAAFALLLAAFGLYSILSLTVTARRREIGVRMALGARSGQVLGDVLADAGRLVFIGLSLGALASWGAATALRSMLYGVALTDPVTIAAVILTLTATSLVAALVPARRAAMTDPIETLRSE